MGENVQAEPDEGNGVLFRFDHIGVPGERDIHLKFGMSKQQVWDMVLEWFHNLNQNDRSDMLTDLRLKDWDVHA